MLSSHAETADTQMMAVLHKFVVCQPKEVKEKRFYYFTIFTCKLFFRCVCLTVDVG